METVSTFFIITLVAILLTDLLMGILIGLFTSSAFILYGNFNKGIRVYREKRLHGVVTRIELPSQVTFLNRSALISALNMCININNLLLMQLSVIRLILISIKLFKIIKVKRLLNVR